MGTIILNGAEIAEECVVGAGALVTQSKKFPPRSLIAGSPATVRRALNEAEIAGLTSSAAEYVAKASIFSVELNVLELT